MENRTPLKEKRNTDLITIWFAISALSGLISTYKYNTDGERALMAILALQFCFLLYRVLTYCFNSLLLVCFRGKKFKINRLKGRVTPIYKIREAIMYGFYVSKYSVYYTKLDLKWSIPFSVLFEEQEYLWDGEHLFSEEPENLEEAWEFEESEKNLKLALEIAEKDKKQQKLDKLNKVFNENYK